VIPQSHSGTSSVSLNDSHTPDAGTTRYREPLRVNVYFFLVGAALVVAAAVGAPLAWDGSYVAFTALDQQLPYSSHGRYYHTILTLPLLAASHVTTDVAVLRTVFAIAEVTAPFVALLLSWLVVRHDAPSLFFWPAIGVTLATLPGQFAFNSEGLASVQFAWPLLLLVLCPRAHYRYLSLGILSGIQLLIYPTAVAVLIITALTSAVTALLKLQPPRSGFLVAIVLALVAGTRALLPLPDYDAEVLASDRLLPTLLGSFRASVLGYPLAAILFTWLGGALSLAARWAAQRRHSGLERLGSAVGLSSTAAVLIVLLPWASDPTLWTSVESFRFWAFAASFPLMVMAVLERVWLDPLARGWSTTRRRSRHLSLAAAVFFAVLSTQSVSWLVLRDHLVDVLAAHSGKCIPASSLRRLTSTPLEHWTLPYYSILIEGRSPKALVLADCAAPNFLTEVQLAPWDSRNRERGWFDLRRSGLNEH
jgi:hypothetical protein